MKKNILAIFMLSACIVVNAQVAIGTEANLTPNTHSILEARSTTKGLLIPRVSLSTLDSKAPVNGTETNAPEGLLVYNTATTGTSPNNVTPGFYYWKPTDNNATTTTGKWVRMIDVAAPTEPWLVQGGINQSTLVTDNIYHTGNVSIGTSSNSLSNSNKLYVNGNIEQHDIDGRYELKNTNTAGYVFSDNSYLTADLSDRLHTVLYTTAADPGSENARIISSVSSNSTNKVHVEQSLVTDLYGDRDFNFLPYSLSLIDYTGYATNDGRDLENTTYLGMSKEGVQISSIKMVGNNQHQFGYSRNSNMFVNGGYFLPKTGPTSGQILMYDKQEIRNPNTNIANTVAYTKWGNITDVIPQEPWRVQGGTTQANSNIQNIYQTGKVAIGQAITSALTGNALEATLYVNKVSSNASAPAVYVNGNVETAGKLFTPSSVFADYVFEKYYTGKSEINKNYNFKSLDEVKDFLKENHHLPGVTSIKDIEKNEHGYKIDVAELSMQQLEKLEELYLHVIEQKEKLDAKDKEIEILKQTQELLIKRLDKLEQAK